ncbi:hypothetical protein RB201_32915 [Streptomyces sp. S1A(2023)]
MTRRGAERPLGNFTRQAPARQLTNIQRAADKPDRSMAKAGAPTAKAEARRRRRSQGHPHVLQRASRHQERQGQRERKKDNGRD